MNPYLQLELGDNEKPRGRTLICVLNPDQETIHEVKQFDINGSKLKEAIFDEILQGRLIALDIFDPIYVKLRPREFSLEEGETLVDLAEKESKDLIVICAPENEEFMAEMAIEQIVVRYANVYKENIYRRVLEDLIRETFRCRKNNWATKYYVGLFRVAQTICSVSKSIREKDQINIDFYTNLLNSYQDGIPFLSIEQIQDKLLAGDGQKWQEMADYIDSFFLSIKKDFPLALSELVELSNNENSEKLLKEELFALYYDFFHHLFEEDYERATTVKEQVKHYYSSRALKEFS